MKKEKYLSKNKLYKEDKVDDYRELVEKCAKKYGNDIAFSYKNESKKIIDVSYIQFKDDIEKFGTSLLDLDFHEKKIGLIAPDRYEWCVSYLAIVNSNNIAVPLDFALPDTEIENLINRSGIECIVFDTKYTELIKSIIKNKTSNLKYAVCFDYDKEEHNILSYKKLLYKGQELIKNGNKSYKDIKIDKDKMSILLFTSGTTSNSKAVMLSQSNVCSNVTGMTTLIKPVKDDNVLIFLPLHHTLACTASFLSCFWMGFRIYFADSIKNVAKNMKEYKIKGLVCVPAVLELMYKRAIKEIKKQNKYVIFKIMSVISNVLYKLNIDVRRKLFKNVLEGFGGSLEKIIYGSASTKKEIIKFFNTIGVSMQQGYGLTEASPIVASESDYFNSTTSVGYPLFNQDVKIVNKDKNGVGEVIVKGSNVMLGYYEDKKRTKEVIKDGWLYTGDLGRFHRSGRLYIVGRKKEIIVFKNGKKVNPEELEKIINDSEYIEESLIYGEIQKNGDYRICTKIVYSIDNVLLQGKTEHQIENLINEEIKRINNNLPIYKHIYKVQLTTKSLEKTTTRKIKRFAEMGS